jgi:hypothetical protein
MLKNIIFIKSFVTFACSSTLNFIQEAHINSFNRYKIANHFKIIQTFIQNIIFGLLHVKIFTFYLCIHLSSNFYSLHVYFEL